MAFSECAGLLIGIEGPFVFGLDAQDFAGRTERLAFQIEIQQLFGNDFDFFVLGQRRLILT